MEDSTTIYVHEMESPIGALLLSATDQGVCAMEFGPYERTAADLEAWSKRWFGSSVRLRLERSFLAEAELQLKQYFSGRRKRFELPLDLRGTPFQRRVWQALCDIPYGETRSYKEIGEAIGAAKAMRAVGGANNRNPLPIIVPCHRVIGTCGDLTGYGGGLSIKRHLLDLEGAAYRA